MGGRRFRIGVLVATAALAASLSAGAAQADLLSPSNLVYITTNDPTPGQNAVLAFRRSADCGLTSLGSFSTRGTGVGNPNFRFGTLDSDQSLIVSPHRRFLFAANSGSDSIAIFFIRSDGTLVRVLGSPFASGGHMPVSLALWTPLSLTTDIEDNLLRGPFVYAANKNEVPGENPANFPRPNYTSFRVGLLRGLVPIPNGTIQLPQGSSPTQTLLSNNGKFVFSTDMLVDFPTNFFPTDGFPAAPGAGGGNTLRSFVIRENGRLDPNPAIRLPGPDSVFPDPLGLLSGSMHVSGTTNGAVGLQDHPSLPILYVSFPLRFQLGVYSWDQTTGRLTLANVVGNSGQMNRFLQVSGDGKSLYTTNELDSTVSAYDLTSPLNPVEVDFDDLRLAPGATQGGLTAQASLTPDGTCLYVLEQRVTDGAGDGSANALHILTTSSAGLDEPFPPINLAELGVPRTARPQGIAAF